MAWGDRKGTLTGNGNSVTNPSVLSGSVSVAIGDLVALVFGQQTNLTAGTVTDNLGNTYTAQNAGNDVGVVSGRAYYSRVTAGGTLTTINVAASASTNDWAAFAAVYTGPFQAPPIDVNPANGTTDVTSPFTCPATGTLAISNELVVCWGAANQSTVWAASSPLLLDGNANNSTNVKVALGSKVTSATTTTSPEFTAAANPSAGVLGTMSFKQVVVQTDGAISAQSSSVSGAGISSSSSTDGAISAQAAVVAGAGKTTSTGTGALLAGVSTVDGEGTVSAAGITGTGALASQPADVEGGGASSSSGSGALAAQSSTADGEGISSSSGSGVLLAQSSDVGGAGVTLSSGTGTLLAQSSDVTGEGAVSGGAISGTGVLLAQASEVDGSGISLSLGAGSLLDQAADVTGAGLSISSGSGALAAASSVVAGAGTVSGAGSITGSGSLHASSAGVSGIGVVSGVVISSRRPLDASGAGAQAQITYVLEGREAVAYAMSEEQQSAVTAVIAGASFEPISGFAVVEQISAAETSSLAKIEPFECLAKADSTEFQGLGRTHALATADDPDLRDFYLLLEAA